MLFVLARLSDLMRLKQGNILPLLSSGIVGFYGYCSHTAVALLKNYSKSQNETKSFKYFVMFSGIDIELRKYGLKSLNILKKSLQMALLDIKRSNNIKIFK